MREFPQTWYRASRWGDPLDIDELIVHRVTAHCIWVQPKGYAGGAPQTNPDGTPKLRKTFKSGASPSREEVLRAALTQIDLAIQRANDERSVQMERRQQALRMLSECAANPPNPPHHEAAR